jgi:hypothetical protein
MKKIFAILIVAALVFSVTAAAMMLIPASEKGEEKGKVGNPPGLEKVVFIHYKKDFGKPGTECGNGVCESGERKTCPADCSGGEETACYKFLKGKAKWRSTESYYVSSNVNADAVGAGVAEWENYGGEIFGQQISGERPWDTYDGYNAITYGDFVDECELAGQEPCVIAVTGVWILGKSILEYDMIFDSDFAWSNNDSSAMDWQNIATHELGHSAGMGDLYDGVCSEETMYGYSSEGETKKRDLNTGDIAGIQALY